MHPRQSPRMYGSTDLKDLEDLKDWPQARPWDCKWKQQYTTINNIIHVGREAVADATEQRGTTGNGL